MGIGLSHCCRGCRCLRWTLGLQRLGVTLTCPSTLLRLHFDCRADTSLDDTDGRYAVFAGFRASSRGPGGLAIAQTIVSCYLVLDRLNRASPRVIVRVTELADVAISYDELVTLPTTGGAIYTCVLGSMTLQASVAPTLPGVFYARYNFEAEAFVDQLWLQLAGSSVRISVAPRSLVYATSPTQTWPAAVQWCQRPGTISVSDATKIRVTARWSGFTGNRSDLNGTYPFGIRAVSGSPDVNPWPNSFYPTHLRYGLLARVTTPGPYDDLYTGGSFDGYKYSTAIDATWSLPEWRWFMAAGLYVPVSASGTPWIQFELQDDQLGVTGGYNITGTHGYRPHFDGVRSGSSEITYGSFRGGYQPLTATYNLDDMRGEYLAAQPLDASGDVGDSFAGSVEDVVFTLLP